MASSAFHWRNAAPIRLGQEVRRLNAACHCILGICNGRYTPEPFGPRAAVGPELITRGTLIEVLSPVELLP